MPIGTGVVWILGAGFSKPLGAPLLTELMTVRSAARVAAAYADVLGKAEAGNLGGNAKLFEAGLNDGEWEHAEEFMERLDLAVANTTARRLYLDWCQTSRTVAGAGFGSYAFAPEKMPFYRATALRMLAAEVCLFLRDADPQMERWSPYRAWADSLMPQDTVITFNYDRVVELAGTAVSRPLWVPTPEEWLCVAEDAQKAGRPKERDQAIALKLHGSVDWKHLGRTICAGVTESGARATEHALSCPAEELAIATPGPTKYSMTQGSGASDGALSPLWIEAGRAIENAEAVVFVGYRMPATDAYTKQWLVDRIRRRLSPQNLINPGNIEPKLPVHTVLGPNVDHEHSMRLGRLLETLGAGALLNQWPLGSEDFLGLVDRPALVRPERRSFGRRH